MSRSNKILLGILTFLPTVLLICYFVYFLSFVLGVIDIEMGFDGYEEEYIARHILGNAVIMIILIIIMAFLSLGIMIYLSLIHI